MSVRPSVTFRQHIQGPTWGYPIYRTSYTPALQQAWERTVGKIRSAIIPSIEKEQHDARSGALRPDIDPAPVDFVKDPLQLVMHDDTSRYDDIDEAGAREAFHAWCSPPGEQVFTIADILANPEASKVWTRADLPVSEWNEYGEGPYVKASARLPAMGADYDGSFKVALTYLWGLIGKADNQGGLDQFLPPTRHKTGERPVYNGRWPEDVDLESLGLDPDEVPTLEHAFEESREPTGFRSTLRPVQVSSNLRNLSSFYETAGKLPTNSFRDPAK
ncbi:hypothetical protein ASPCAL08653 [Aspergillus calidoustus]|uniref:Uncharacterized protein n=1 Tax=Aspergillus calidoustus TaxID=454130 RepID=A0A0U5GTU3_ASPCI|nr:hypothetical protein ASPCAL08653 [Aspergillus calidoustus]